MKNHLSTVLCCVLVCLLAGAASAQSIGLLWNEGDPPEGILAYDSAGSLLVEGATAFVIADLDADGPEWGLDYDGGGLPAITLGDEGDAFATDFNGAIMSYDFVTGFLGQGAGKVAGSWTVDQNPSWESADLYLLLYLPAASSPSGVDEYAFSLPVPLSNWPNQGVAHQITGGGDIDPATGTWHTVPVPEPATLGLVVSGLGLLLFNRKK